jgi:hypothetical protein
MLYTHTLDDRIPSNGRQYANLAAWTLIYCQMPVAYPFVLLMLTAGAIAIMASKTLTLRSPIGPVGLQSLREWLRSSPCHDRGICAPVNTPLVYTNCFSASAAAAAVLYAVGTAMLAPIASDFK